MITGRFALPISAGSAPEPPPSTVGNRVTYYDPFGDVIKIQYVLDGEDATPPTPPTFDLLTFAEWNNPSTNITYDRDIGAIYDTTDGKTYVFATFNNVIGLQPTLVFDKSTTDLLTIDWGDGETSTSSGNGGVAILKTTSYTSSGNYIITIECNGFYRLGSYLNFFGSGTYLSAPYKIYFGANINVTNAGIGNHQIEKITLNSGLTGNINTNFAYANARIVSLNFPSGLTGSILGGIFQNDYSIRKIIFPSEMNGVISFSSSFQNCFSLESTILPNGLTGSIGGSLFSTARSLRSALIPIGITSLGSGCFANNTSMNEYIFQSIIPPTMSNINVFSSIPAFTKIYVPDESIDDYKTATNWVSYADYIYPISTRII